MLDGSNESANPGAKLVYTTSRLFDSMLKSARSDYTCRGRTGHNNTYEVSHERRN